MCRALLASIAGTALIGLLCGSGPLWAFEDVPQTNIVVILADDMGFGDVGALNSASTIPTPNIDRLAAEGMTFTDAHTPSAVCTPTRYGLLTGRYCWRTSLKEGVLGGYSPPLIDSSRPTVATLLRGEGYQTAFVGKWHLGMEMPTDSARRLTNGKWDDPGVDYSETIAEGPFHRGFDSVFCISASLDMPPYVYIENDRFASVPTIRQPAVPSPGFVREGPRSEDFVFADVLDRLTEEATATIRKHADASEKFFLYFALTAPHKPTLPHERFRGKTDLGPYGDFIVQVDATVGRVLDTIDEQNLTHNTLVIFTSDNGSYMYRLGDDAKDHADDAGIQGYRAGRHHANRPFRGTKADIWEGGHHVPFFARWPAQIEQGSNCDATICLTDLFATCAEIANTTPPEGAAEDSVSLLPMMRGVDATRGAPVIHHSAGGMFAIRDGRWKLVLGDGSGGRQRPRGEPFGKPFQLFDFSADIAEKNDVAARHPEVVEQLTARFEEIYGSDIPANSSR